MWWRVQNAIMLNGMIFFGLVCKWDKFYLLLHKANNRYWWPGIWAPEPEALKSCRTPGLNALLRSRNVGCLDTKMFLGSKNLNPVWNISHSFCKEENKFYRGLECMYIFNSSTQIYSNFFNWLQVRYVALLNLWIPASLWKEIEVCFT